MKHNWKKSTLAFLLTLLMLTGLFPSLGGSAWAASPPLKVGATYYIGDTLKVSGQTSIRDDRGDHRIINEETKNMTVPTPEYKNGRWEFDFIYPNSNTYQESGLYLGYGKTDGTESVKGFKCVGGDGVNNPYTFELVLGASSVALNKDSLSLLVGNTETLTAIVTPETAVDKSVTWSSSDESIATVDNTGKVTAVAIGTATITAALTEDPTKTATCEVTVTEVTIDSVPYLDWNGSMLVEKTGDEACKDYTLVSSTTTTFENDNWYVVPSTSIEINSRITVTGEAHLILCDGATLNAKAGITVGSGNSLTIYAQSEGGSMGALNAIGIANESASPKIYAAGIGSYNNDAGTITINGGKITAYGNQTRDPGQSGGAGIGGGYNYSNPSMYVHNYTGFRGADVTINGGIVTATGSRLSPGIGNGPHAGDKFCSVTINGGIVTATGGVRGAGIGGGYGSRPADVTITGGHVTATSSAVGAGIGNGESSNSYDPNITITGGTVIASGGNIGEGYKRGAGIGSGGPGGYASISNRGIITIGSNMTVYAGAQPNPTTVVSADDFKANHTQQYVKIERRLVSYTITVDNSIKNGTVTPSETSAVEGTAITLTVAPATGYGLTQITAVWGDSQTALTLTKDSANENKYTFTMPAGDVTVNATFSEPTITGADLALNGSLDFRFYVDIPAGIDTTGANMTFSIGGGNRRTIENIPLTSAGISTDTAATKGQRIFSFPVYAIEMAEDVTAVFHYKAGGEDKTAKLTTSIENYLDKVEELNKDPNYYEKLAELITATRNYGHYMQPYLANVHKFSVDSYATIKQGSEFTPLTDDEMTALSGFERKKNSEYDKSNIKSVGYFLTLNERTTLNILLGFNNEPGVISATANGERATVNANPELKNPDGSSATGIYRLIEIPNIAANNLDMTYTVIVKDGETTVYDVNMSALSFVYAVLNANGTGDIEKQALTALYRYNVAADAYGSNG